MATWRNNDREESKPTWLSKAQKRNVVRTVRGWELPLDGTSYGGHFAGWRDGLTAINGGPTAYIPHTELLVALPYDVTGGSFTSGNAYGSTFFIRGATGAYGNNYGGQPSQPGFTGSGTNNRDLPNYTPYFTCPFNGDTCTAGGPDGAGVSHNGTLGSIMGTQNYAYRVNKYGVSSLGLPYGVTAYIKVCVNDYNFTQNISITANNVNGGATGFSMFAGSDLLDTTKVPAEVYDNFFGPTAAVNNNIAVLRFTNLQATGSGTGWTNGALNTTREISIGLTAWDNSGVAGGGFTSGATAAGVVVKLRFDR